MFYFAFAPPPGSFIRRLAFVQGRVWLAWKTGDENGEDGFTFDTFLAFTFPLRSILVALALDQSGEHNFECRCRLIKRNAMAGSRDEEFRGVRCPPFAPVETGEV